jgi:RNA recognition motif-containing protein
MASKLYIGGLPFAYTEDDLKKLVAEFGEVTSAVIIMDKFSNRSKGFGFVEFEDEAAAKAAIDKLNGSELDGRNITVDNARPPRERDDRGGGYNRS